MIYLRVRFQFLTIIVGNSVKEVNVILSKKKKKKFYLIFFTISYYRIIVTGSQIIGNLVLIASLKIDP